MSGDTVTTVHLARHGETIWHAENRYTGVSDVPLTGRGREQAASLAAWAADAGLDAIASSPLVRAVDTASPACAAAGLELSTDPRLREVDFGDGEGLTRTEMAERFPRAWEGFVARPARHPLPHGESGVDAIVRASPALDELVTAHRGGRVLVVMHSTLLRLLLCDRIGMDPDDYRRAFPTVVNAALTTLRIDDAGTALLGFNVPPRAP